MHVFHRSFTWACQWPQSAGLKRQQSWLAVGPGFCPPRVGVPVWSLVGWEKHPGSDAFCLSFSPLQAFYYDLDKVSKASCFHTRSARWAEVGLGRCPILPAAVRGNTWVSSRFTNREPEAQERLPQGLMEGAGDEGRPSSFLKYFSFPGKSKHAGWKGTSGRWSSTSARCVALGCHKMGQGGLEGVGRPPGRASSEALHSWRGPRMSGVAEAWVTAVARWSWASLRAAGSSAAAGRRGGPQDCGAERPHAQS